ncbi:MAG TPA: hypothetical protein PLO33_00485 [Kouleothrix sp.]|uniref:hypothetical protein n=1 Tax=Kouleothrix sp. TaxID=2779161 RepID=UPI002C2097AC|nr:hypothetical protein [Kouleothrix sp.]HRC74119.1 hypothetical protein [Kouleothrix sp.]
MHTHAPIWRNTTVFFVSQLLILVCCGLYLLQWRYTEGQATPPRPAIAASTVAQSDTWPATTATVPQSQPFWSEAAGIIRPFAGYALLILLGSSMLFISYEIMRSGSTPADEP